MKPNLIIIGLGNPGDAYARTRHNAGFRALDILSTAFGEGKWMQKDKFLSDIQEARIVTVPVLLAKPQTFMNLSGEAVSAVSHFYKIDPEDILVVFDDLDLPEGKIRIRKNGSSGGHKGMNSIIQCLGTDQIKRIRLGIGHEDGIDAADYVLGKFSPEGKEIMKPIIEDALKMLDDYLSMPFEDFMSRYN